MKKIIFVIMFVNFSNLLYSENLDSMFVELDRYIAKSDYYIGIKENKIGGLTKKFKSNYRNTTLQLQFSAELFEEYKSFKYDSAEIKIKASKSKLGEIVNPDENAIAMIQQLNKSLDEAAVRVKELQDWLKKYFSKSTSDRKMMFYDKIETK